MGEEYEDILEELYDDFNDKPKADKPNTDNEKRESDTENPNPGKNTQEPATHLEPHFT